MESLITKKINYAIEKKKNITDVLKLSRYATWGEIVNAILELNGIIKRYEDENSDILDKLGLEDYKGDFVSPTSPVRQPMSMSGERVWTDGDNYYYTDTSFNSYLINVENQEITPITFTDMPSNFNPVYIWTDGENTYYSYNNTQKVLNKQTRTWSDKTWTGLNTTSGFTGNNIWYDGNDIYYTGDLNNTHTSRKLNKETGSWEYVSFSIESSVYGATIWTDGNDIYSSISSRQYKLNRVQKKWEDFSWNINITGSRVFNIGDEIYVWETNSSIKKLDKENLVWESCDLGLPDGNSYYYNGSPIWGNGENYYLSWGNIQAKFDFNENKFVGFGWKDMSVLSAYNTKHIFAFKDNMYYIASFGNRRFYILNKKEKRFDSLLESYLSSASDNYPQPDGIWTDGDNLYYSYGYSSSQYWHSVYDEENNEWKPMNWSNSGLPYFKGQNVWHNGDDTYCDGYKLDKENKTWTQVYSNIFDGTGRNIWTDGENLYYSYGSYQKVYNKTNDSWDNKTWNISNLYGMYIWSLGDNVYYSNNDTQYMLDKETGNWVAKTWKDININTNTNSNLAIDVRTFIWTDGDNYYYGFDYMFNDFNYLINKIIETVPRNSFNEYLKGEITTIYEEDLKGLTTTPTFTGNTNITTVNIPVNITTISNESFKNCSSLSEINIPASVTNIGSEVFNGCSLLTTINFGGTQAEWSSITKESDWNDGSSITVVSCSDGDINLE